MKKTEKIYVIFRKVIARLGAGIVPSFRDDSINPNDAGAIKKSQQQWEDFIQSLCFDDVIPVFENEQMPKGWRDILRSNFERWRDRLCNDPEFEIETILQMYGLMDEDEKLLFLEKLVDEFGNLF